MFVSFTVFTHTYCTFVFGAPKLYRRHTICFDQVPFTLVKNNVFYMARGRQISCSQWSRSPTLLVIGGLFYAGFWLCAGLCVCAPVCCLGFPRRPLDFLSCSIVKLCRYLSLLILLLLVSSYISISESRRPSAI